MKEAVGGANTSIKTLFLLVMKTSSFVVNLSDIRNQTDIQSDVLTATRERSSTVVCTIYVERRHRWTSKISLDERRRGFRSTVVELVQM